jgi:hypothetical protein
MLPSLNVIRVSAVVLKNTVSAADINYVGAAYAEGDVSCGTN